MDNGIDTLTALKEKIETALDMLLAYEESSFSTLFEGARYSLLGSGKRIRPLLTLIATKMLGGNIEAAIAPACALEMIHTYSLIHDDLPCMDNDDLRRGKPTLHRVYNEGHAMLVGDYLLTFAFEVLANSPNLSSDQKIALIRVLSYSAGGEGMIGGQVMDLSKGKASTQEIHSRKTGALFSASLEFGGIISSASPQDLDRLRLFGKQFGLLFQLVDDILDHDHPEGEEMAYISVKETYNKCQKTLATYFPGSALLEELLGQLVGKISCAF